MSAEQKALFRQLQLTGLGLIIGIAGIMVHHPYLPWIGVGVALLGLGRYLLIKKLQNDARDL